MDFPAALESIERNSINEKGSNRIDTNLFFLDFKLLSWSSSWLEMVNHLIEWYVMYLWIFSLDTRIVADITFEIGQQRQSI